MEGYAADSWPRDAHRVLSLRERDSVLVGGVLRLGGQVPPDGGAEPAHDHFAGRVVDDAQCPRSVAGSALMSERAPRGLAGMKDGRTHADEPAQRGVTPVREERRLRWGPKAREPCRPNACSRPLWTVVAL